LLLAAKRYGPDSIGVITRTAAGSWYTTYVKHGRRIEVEAWVIRFLRAFGLFDIGVPYNNVIVCKNKSGEFGKGDASQDLGHSIIHSHPPNQVIESFLAVFLAKGTRVFRVSARSNSPSVEHHLG